MDAELIILSSDEDYESSKPSNSVTKTPASTKNIEVICLDSVEETFQQNPSSREKINEIESEGEIEIIDCTYESFGKGNSNKGDRAQKHSETNDVEAEKNTHPKNDPRDKVTNAEMPNDKSSNLKKSVAKTKTQASVSTRVIPRDSSKAGNKSTLGGNQKTENKSDGTKEDLKNQAADESLNIFSEFVQYCAFVKEHPRYREKLIEKCIKYVERDHPEYINSREFRIFIKKCRNSTSEKNLYLLVKSIAEFVKAQKKTENQQKYAFVKVKEKFQGDGDHLNLLHQQKRLSKIQKIIKKLNQMGCVIRELEKKEVDLNDEENSVYLKLQRERFWLVYSKLGELTNDVSVDRVFNRKIHFTETDYPVINKCIEKWLNETKSFPDFADIMKILESKKKELNLSSNEDSFRILGIEIFQKVGNLLQTRRRYDLWNSLCGFLEGSKDPASKAPELEKAFKKNYEARLRKEEKIYHFYSELQKKKSLKPVEVSEDACGSSESGKEEEEEITNIEKTLARRLTGEFKISYTDEDKLTSDQNKNVSSHEKQSKNNFRNCKSLKWRSEKEGTSKSDEPVKDQEHLLSNTKADDTEKTSRTIEKLLDLKLIFGNSDILKVVDVPSIQRERLPSHTVTSPEKRSNPFESEGRMPKRRRDLTRDEINDTANLKKDKMSLNKTPVFDVGYCQIVTNYNFKERRKVFRDLTNVNGLMKKPGLGHKTIDLFTPMLYGRYSPRKETAWKKKFRINLRDIKPKNQKCALNEEKKTDEKISSNSSSDSKNEDRKNNSGSGPEGADLNAQGNGQEEDNNDKGDENRKNGKIEDENDDHEEDDDDEEKEDETTEADEHSSKTEKTEKENKDSSKPTANENHMSDDVEVLSVKNDETGTGQDAIDEGVTQEAKEEECKNVDENLEYDESDRCEDSKFRDSEDVEFENFKNSLEPICVLKEDDTSDVLEKANNEYRSGVHRKSRKRNARNVGEKSKRENEKFKAGPFTRSKLRTGRSESGKSENHNQKRLPMTTAWTPPAETSQPKPRKMSASDEERVKRFLMHSPSSISITPPKKLTLSKPPSQSALQALATLRNLKGISATIVKGKPKTEDVTAIVGQARRQTDQSTPVGGKKRRTDLPVISSVQSVNTLTPKIVTVQGNVSGFENLWPEMKNHKNATSKSSPIRISKVWGSLPESVEQANRSNYPSCSSRKNNPSANNQTKKKNPKKQVEYVVLD